MKKLLVLLLALAMIVSLTACGGNDNTTTTKKGGANRVPSTDYFWEKYDFTEAWMLPDGGVYTGYKYIDPEQNSVGNEAVQVTVYDITEEQIEEYIAKIETHGYQYLIGGSYTKNTDGKTAMIEIKKYLEDGYIIVIIDPSI